jgi:hypothetical protein
LKGDSKRAKPGTGGEAVSAFAIMAAKTLALDNAALLSACRVQLWHLIAPYERGVHFFDGNGDQQKIAGNACSIVTEQGAKLKKHHG